MSISAGVNITTGSPLPTGYQLAAYPATTFAATGGTGTGYSWTWAAASGSSLPAGLSLSTAGLISGAPTAAGTFSIVVTVTDSALNTASATFSLTVEATLTITTTSPLKTGTANVAYSQQLAATGGTGPGTYTWSTNAAGTSSLAAVGLSLSSAGLVSGPSPSLGTANFAATVTDSASHTASVTFAVTISNALTITTTNLPAAFTGAGYSQTLAAAGGTGLGYLWSVTGTNNLATFNLSLSSAGVISGAPATTGTASFTAKVTDSASNTATQALTIQVYNPLTLPAPNPPSLGSATAGQFYTGTITASGGSGSYTWTVTGLSDNLGSSYNGATLTVSGTPNAVTTVSFNVSVQDSNTLVTVGPYTYTINVNNAPPLTLPPAGALPNATINQNYSGGINASGGVGPYTFTVNGSAIPTDGSQVAVADGIWISSTGGNTLSIGGTPTSAQTVTLTNVSVTDSASHSAGPNTYTIAVVNPSAVYTVSGTLSYGGSQTGWTYLVLTNNNCCGSNVGTSISEATLKSGGAFTIHGVQPGTYTLQAFMDNLGYGAQNASNPAGSVSNLTVTTSSLTGVSVTLGDPGAVTISSAPTWNSSNGLGAFSGGAFITFQTIQNNNGIEIPASYTVQWSTSSSFTSVTGSTSFAATGRNNPWIVNGLTNGTTYYFRAQGVAGSSTGPMSAISPGVLIGAPTGANTVSGQVTFTETAKGPLYVGFYDQSTGSIYADVVGSKASPPTSLASYTVHVPSGSNYFFFGIIDQNNSGLIDAPGQISNTNGTNKAPVVINGNLSNENLTLPNANAVATVSTQNQEQINSGNTTYNYSISLNVNGLIKLPVAVELTAESNPGAVIPVDIATGVLYGNRGFSFYTSLNGATPKVGDTYTLHVTYSDGNSEDLIATIGAVLNAFATGLSPQGTGVSVQPNFSWTDPANASNYTYQFWLCCNQNGTIWQIPSNNSKTNGFSSSITSITWGTDPTNPNPPNPPSVSSLNGGTYYSWQIQAQDVNGNSAQVQVSFQTATAPLSLPAAGSLGTTTVNQSYSGSSINASGGVPGYSFTVNGSSVPTDGTQVGLGNGSLYVSNNGGNTLSIGGTPTSTGTVSFTVAVTDSTPTTVGPYTYTISVIAGAPLTLQTTSLPGGNNGWPYSTNLKANGGSGNYTWSVISGNLPAGLFINSSSGDISGTPTANGTANFTVQVTDTETPPVSAQAALSILITNCTYAALNGKYAFMANGWKGTADASSFVGDFVANGAGTISSGSVDTNSSNKGPQNVAITGTYCVSSNNLALINLIPSGQSGSATFAVALDSTGNGHIIRYDSTSSEVGAGLLRKQQTTAFSTGEINGNYAFGLVGADSSGNANPFALAGEFNSNGSGTLSGEIDYDSGGSGGGAGNTTISASDFIVASSGAQAGRGTATITVTGKGNLNFVFYVVSSSEMLMASADTETPPIILAGQVLKQSGSFTDASFNGVSVMEDQYLDGGTNPTAVVGFLTGSGTGSFTGNFDVNDGGTITTQPVSGNYSVDSSTGRVTLTAAGNHPPVFYLVAKNQAFLVGTGGSPDFGTLTPQTGTSFTNASLSGNYLGGSQQPVNYNVSSELDAVNANGAAGTFNVTTDNNSNCGSGSACPDSKTISGIDYTVSSDGRVLVTCGSGSGGNCPAGTQVGIMYIISTSQAVFLTVQDNNPYLIDFHK